MTNKLSKYQDYIVILLLALITLIIYLPSINAPFIFDDNHMIVHNLLIKNPHYFGMFFKGYVTSYPVPKGMCRPLLMFTFAFNYLTGRLNPTGYHIINVLFHFLNAVLLFFLLKTLNKDIPKTLAFLVSLLFVVHPINTEAVSYISSRSDLMVTFFILSGFILYMKRRYIPATIMYVLALLSKETGLCLPIILIAYDFIYNIKDGPILKKWFNKRSAVLYTALIAVTIGYILYKSTIFSPTPTRILRSYYSNILMQSAVTFLYLGLFLFPYSLNIVHYIPHLTSLASPIASISATGIIIMIILIFVLIKKQPLISAGLSWFLIGMLPKFYARLHFVSMEHHFYLAGIGIYILLTALLNKRYTQYRKYTVYTLIGIIILFSALAAMRNYEYGDAFLFWMVSGKRNNKSATISNNLGIEYLKRNLLTLAEKEFKKASKFSRTVENKFNSEINLANIYLKRKEYKKAVDEVKNTLLLTKLPAQGAYQTLGVIYLEMGKKKEALNAWKKEIKLYPTSYETYLNLGIFYFKKQDFGAARYYFRKATFYSPDHYAGYFGLAQILEKENKPKKAIRMYRKTLSLKPDDAASHYFLGALYAKEGNGKALDEFRKAIEINPRFAQAHNDLAVAYASMDPPRWHLAEKEAKTAKSLGYKVNEKFLQLIARHTD